MDSGRNITARAPPELEAAGISDLNIRTSYLELARSFREMANLASLTLRPTEVDVAGCRARLAAVTAIDALGAPSDITCARLRDCLRLPPRRKCSVPAKRPGSWQRGQSVL